MDGAGMQGHASRGPRAHHANPVSRDQGGGEMTSIVRRRAVGALLLLLVLAMPGAPAVAAPPINHEHPYLQGNYGVHILIDGGEPYSGVACQYVAGRLDRMRIRRPIAFAVSSAQQIVWRYQIEGTNDSDLGSANWHLVVTSSLQKVWAQARQAAPFLPRIQQFGGLTYAHYRVVVKILWFSPSPDRVPGRTRPVHGVAIRDRIHAQQR